MTPRDRSTLAWLLQAISGGLLLGLLALHLIANHFLVEGGLRTYWDVVRYLANPIVLPFEVCFLIIVTTHALLGVRAVIFDFGISIAAARRWNVALFVIGLCLVGYGLWLTWLIVNQAGMIP